MARAPGCQPEGCGFESRPRRQRGFHMSQVGLGRVYVEDTRDERYRMESILPSRAGHTYRYWHANGWWGDQDSTSKCVPYSWAHWVEDGPTTFTATPHNGRGAHIRGKFLGAKPAFDIDEGYDWMQRNDYWEGEAYDGTSVRAGADFLRNKGLISNYYWAWDTDTIVKALLEKGPVVVGTAWYMDMFIVNDEGLISIGGASAGGHAYLLNGVNTSRGLIRIKNSWGHNWGRNGHAYIPIEEMDTLIKDHGEACIAVSTA